MNTKVLTILSFLIFVHFSAWPGNSSPVKQTKEVKKMNTQNGCYDLTISIERVKLDTSRSGFTIYDLDMPYQRVSKGPARGNPNLLIEPNPHMHDIADNNMHVNSGAVDFTYSCGPRADTTLKGEYFLMRGNKGEFPGIFPLFTALDSSHVIAPSFGRAKTSFFLLNANNLRQSHRIYVPGRRLNPFSMIFPKARKKVFKDTSGGAYFYVNDKGNAIVPVHDRKSERQGSNYIFILVASGNEWIPTVTRIKIHRHAEFVGKTKIIAVLPDYQGNVWFTFNNGYVGVIPSDIWTNILTGAISNDTVRTGVGLYSFASDNLPFQEIASLKLDYMRAVLRCSKDTSKIRKQIEALFDRIRKVTPAEDSTKINDEFKRNFIQDLEKSRERAIEMQTRQFQSENDFKNLQRLEKDPCGDVKLKKLAQRFEEYREYINAKKYLKRGNGESRRKNTEEIQNSMCVGADGIYILSEFALYKFHLNAQGCIALTWDDRLYLRFQCDLCYWNDFTETPGHVNRGSGTTPTLMDDIVAIGDNAPGHINLNVFNQFSGELVDKERLLPKKPGSACENSVVAHGNTFWMCNTYGYTNPLKEKLPKHAEGGMAKFMLSANGIEADTVFHGKNLSFASAVPKLSLCPEEAVMYMYNQNNLDSGSNGSSYKQWGLTAVNHESGEILYTVKPSFRAADPDTIRKKLALFTGGRKSYFLKLFNNIQCTFAIGPDSGFWVGCKRGFLRIHN